MSTLFGQSSGGLSFGQNNNQQQQNTSNAFGSSNTIPQKPLFGALPTTATTTQGQTSGGLFGSANQTQQGGGGLFGGLGTTTNQQNQQPQQGGGLFGGFGSANNQQSQQPNQSQQGGGLFGGFGQSTQQQQQQQNQQQNQPTQVQQASIFGQTQGQSRLFVASENGLPQKSVPVQMETAFQKWNPQSPETSFQTYLYNTVPVEQAPFYGPTPLDNEAKWEEALSKKPSPGAVPVLVPGFEGLGKRMLMQFQALTTLRGRLHEINEGLNGLLQRHDLEISIRAAECRRKHLRISQQCLNLAAKTQILRNRGYAMDSAEEELRKNLLALERKVMDPVLNGRGEEIWARMVSVRERGRQLQREFDRAGSGLSSESGQTLDEAVLVKTKKILEDYSSQLAHLTREMAQIEKDWAEWESSKPPSLIR
ncbi:Nucleoporin nup57 [Lecanora helva]